MKKFQMFLKLCILFVIYMEIVWAEPIWYMAAGNKRLLIDNEEKYNWYQAFHECSRYDAQLVVIDTELKNRVLTKVLKNFKENINNLWIGGTDAFGEAIDNKRSFYWSPTEQELTFTNWAKTQPDNFINKEHCLYIMGRAANFPWNDMYCDTKGFGFICEEVSELSNAPIKKGGFNAVNNSSVWAMFM